MIAYVCELFTTRVEIPVRALLPDSRYVYFYTCRLASDGWRNGAVLPPECGVKGSEPTQHSMRIVQTKTARGRARKCRCQIIEEKRSWDTSCVMFRNGDGGGQLGGEAFVEEAFH